MALPLTNNADGGTNGTALTAASGGNTGGASGSFFDVVTPGTSQTITFDTAVAMGTSGASIKFTLAAASALISWTTSLGTLTTNQRLGGRYYVRFSTAVTASWQCLRVLTGTTSLLSLGLTATGLIRMFNNAGTTLATGTVVLSTATWYRFEWDFTGVGTATGAFTVNVYLGDGTTIVDSMTGTGAAFGTTAPNDVRLGQTAAAFASGTTLNFDDIVVNATGLPGAARATARQLAALGVG